jgi:hypothetical protein
MKVLASSKGMFSFTGRSGYRFGYLSNRKTLGEKSFPRR